MGAAVASAESALAAAISDQETESHALLTAKAGTTAAEEAVVAAYAALQDCCSYHEHLHVAKVQAHEDVESFKYEILCLETLRDQKSTAALNSEKAAADAATAASKAIAMETHDVVG